MLILHGGLNGGDLKVSKNEGKPCEISFPFVVPDLPTLRWGDCMQFFPVDMVGLTCGVSELA